MKLPLTTLLLLTFSFTLAQGEANIWYFGRNAGLDFNSGTPVALNDGQLSTLEGVATIADVNGQLLFYTDGITVWDRNHNVMLNGTGLFGNPSSTQSGVIVPKPNDPTIYYIFTVDAESGPGGLRYSEVDMTLNGGNGGITSLKNILLNNPNSEKISAVRHCNGNDYWVVSHDLNNNFMTYAVTDLGVDVNPVVSSVGTTHPNPHGYLKISPDGRRVAVAKVVVNPSFPSFIEIFDFDASTGTLTNSILIDVFDESFGGAYGLEFSPNSEILYVSDLSFQIGIPTRVHQFDITLPNATAIINSDTIIHEGQDLIAALQLGPDGKIYLANNDTEFLDVIENPDVLGVNANYVNRAVSLNGNISTYGLPTFIQSTFSSASASFSVSEACFGDTYSFTSNFNTDALSYFWDFGDGNTSTLEAPMHLYQQPGVYTVSLTIDSTCNGLQTVTQEVGVFEVPVIDTISDVELCQPEGLLVDLSQFDSDIVGNQSSANLVVSYYENQDDAEAGNNPVDTMYTLPSNPTVIYARLGNGTTNSCYDVTEFSIGILENCTIPQGISPNGDGLNDTFDISWMNAKSVKIFNRNGIEVYQARNYKNEWGGQDKNGNIVPTGTYFYMITDEDQEMHNGWVYVKR